MQRNVYLFGLAALIIALGIDLLAGDASLLPALLFWTAIPQGIIALAAAADLSQGRWILSIKDKLHRFLPLLILPPFAFLIYALHHTPLYAWHEHPTAWLEPTFFTIRNVAFQLLTFGLAYLYVRASRGQSPRTGVWAVLYCLCFVTAQTMQGIDWVMSFEYPWISTLYGAFFFIEALYLGVATMALLSLLLLLRHGHSFEKVLRDSGALILGFALFWAGQLYAQYLTIWYGNIPEEVAYVAKRVQHSPWTELSIFVVLAMFVIPFAGMIPRRSKVSPALVLAAVVLIYAGYMVEKVIYIAPVAPLSPLFTVLQFIALGLPAAYLLRQLIRSPEAEKAAV